MTRLPAGLPKNRGSILDSGKRFFLRPTQLLPSGYPWALSAGAKYPGREVNHSLASSAEVLNAWGYTLIRLYVCMV